MTPTILHGDCRDKLKEIPDGTVQCCVTSPPYWNLRSYLSKGHTHGHLEIGQEKTPGEYVETIVGVMREVRRCLHESGTVFLNVGDSYAREGGHTQGCSRHWDGRERDCGSDAVHARLNAKDIGLKPKDLCLIPWRLIIALQEDGWWCRSIICWAKKAPMPESCLDRPTNSWEPIFLLAKSQNYFYDAEAVKEPSVDPEGTAARYKHEFWGETTTESKGRGRPDAGSNTPGLKEWSGTRNQRNVWHLGPEGLPDYDIDIDHFATYPTEIPRRAILAGTSARGCCPKCFSPWVRVVERTPARSKKCPKTDGLYQAQGGEGEKKTGTIGMSGGGRIDGETRTIGWKPGCGCYDWKHCCCCENKMDAYDKKHGDALDCGHNICAECLMSGAAIDHQCAMKPIPCTVLDPFGGSGTTGMVATELGRKSILCELNDEYLPLIERRTNVTPGLNLA